MSNCRNGFKIIFLLFALASILPFKAYAYNPTESFDDLSNPDIAARVEEGKKLFKANCAACHKVEGKLLGPGLADIWTLWETQERLIKWVHNSQEMINSGDAQAVKLFNENNKLVMPPFPQLSNEQVVSILEYYVQAEQKKLFDAKPAAGGATAQKDATIGGEAAGDSTPNKWILITIIGVLAIVAITLYSVTSKLDRLVQEKATGEIAEEGSIASKILNKKLLGAIVILGIVFLGYNIVRGAIDLGRSQGYAPEQPIKFSHALHAGQNKIDCQYCHSGAEKSRHAVIPSVAVCMNCHKYVQEGPKFGNKEIAKIYEYSGWDPESSTFKNAPKPIQWVKVHNLPDYVYFNHSQHVKVGGIECQTCHGNVQEMEVVQQFAPLSMGWCINCHRQTDVQFANNDYYSIFEKYHDEIKKGERSGVTVNDIGGTECAKCHY
ncbi:MAG: c-type cytochrome [Chitinophagales bacterium]|nr:c-type cytochrome [Chitinophagales bacterium]